MKITVDQYGSKEVLVGRSNSKIRNLWRFVVVIVTLATTCSALLLCKTYIALILLWIENQDRMVMSFMLLVLFVLVSLPISIGYIVLVAAEGYLFGLVRGLAFAVIAANVGLLIAHNLLKLVGHHRSVYRFTNNDTAQAIMRVISGPLSFKIVLCSRLTPIPFGLQNTIFALSNVNTKVYHIASLLGLLPAQFVAVYVGSTLRSMQDVLENRHISSATYLFVAMQLTLATFLMIWFSAKARQELLKALAESENGSREAKSTYSIV